MDLKRLSNSELHKSFVGKVQVERNALKDVLLHVIEVNRRQMYFDYDCTSLFAYMTGVMGYSNGPAQRRIDAALLSSEIPLLVENIDSGAIKLDQVRLVQQSIRQVVKETHRPISIEQKIQVINEIVGKSQAESEVIVASAFDVKIKKSVRVQRQADESVRMEISFSEKQWAKLEEMRTLLSHSLPSGSWDDVFEYVADKVIQQKSKLIEKRKYTKKSQSRLSGQEVTSESVGSEASGLNQQVERRTDIRSARTAIPAEIQRQIFRRDQYCQHRNPVTGKKCATKWKLQTDHIVPVWAGGGNSLSNLQLLCAGHNQAKYRKEAGIRREKYIGR